MVLNLLQRFSVDEAKELILKSFGYFSSDARLVGLFAQLEQNNEKLEEALKFNCWCRLTSDDLKNYNKVKDVYVQNRKVAKTIRKQERSKNRPLSQEAINYENFVKEKLNEMHSFKCDTCKIYKKHMKSLELAERFSKRKESLEKEIETQRDIFWNKFLSHRAVLERFGYLTDDYPTEKGKTASQIRSENELFLAEIIFSGVLDGLTPAELASVVCAVTTEDLRSEMYSNLPLSTKTRKTLNKIKDIKRKVDRVQTEYNVDDNMYINSYFSVLIEMWVNGAEWDDIMSEVDQGEGDIVRCFKRVVDVLRQFITIDNVPEELVYTAREAIDAIQREPIDVD
jgi:ATP-dependent RNA helicase HelY